MIRTVHSDEYISELISLFPKTIVNITLDLGCQYGRIAAELSKVSNVVLAVDVFEKDALQEFHINVRGKRVIPLKGPASFFRDSFSKDFFDMIHLDLSPESINSFRHHVHIYKDTLKVGGLLATPKEPEKLDILKHNGFSCHEGGTIIAAKRVE